MMGPHKPALVSSSGCLADFTAIILTHIDGGRSLEQAEPMEEVHGTSLSLGAKGVLLLGPSDIGKSDLALRLIDRGAVLIADDYTELALSTDKVILSAPATIRGRMEVRGIGIIELAVAEPTPLELVVELVARDRVPRLPEPTQWVWQGVGISRINLCSFDASTPQKIMLALQQNTRNSTS